MISQPIPWLTSCLQHWPQCPLAQPKLLTACPVHTELGETISPCRRVPLILKQTLTWVPSFPRLFTPLIYSKRVCLQPGKLSPVSEPSTPEQASQTLLSLSSCFNFCPTGVENAGARGLCLLGQQWMGTGRIPGGVSGWCAAPAPCSCLRQAEQSVPSSQVGSWMLTQLMQPQPSHTNPAKPSAVGSARFEDGSEETQESCA